MAQEKRWQDWVGVVLGLWLIIAPFALGYSAEASATWSHIVVGLIVGGAAAWAALEHPEGSMPGHPSA